MGLDTVTLSAVVVFVIFIMLSGLITYHKIFCTCICKQHSGQGFFIDSCESDDMTINEKSDLTTTTTTTGGENKMTRYECCCCICLINRKMDVTKHVYVREGQKSVYNSMTTSTCSTVSKLVSWLIINTARHPSIFDNGNISQYNKDEWEFYQI